MSTRHKLVATGSVMACATAVLVAGSLSAGAAEGGSFGHVSNANPRFGVQNNVLGAGLTQTSVAWGALPLTNPDTANGITTYGYNTSNSAILTQDPKESFKTEPDKNVYLVMGTHHYLFQGHETGPRGYVTRIDLDQPNPLLRVALISDTDANGAALPTFDGITWDPFSQQLLLTAESSFPKGGVWAVQLTADGEPVTGKAIALPGLGSGGYEGIQNDSDGNIWIVEDIGGSTVPNTNGKIPNSYVYRFVPVDRTDLTKGGALQALQVLRKDGTAVTAAQLTINPADQVITDLHTYGTTLKTAWVPVHSGTDAFNATTFAAAASATPFKRPENAAFRPGTSFRDYYFTETGDTNATSTLPGAFGAVFHLSQKSPSAMTGTISPEWIGDVQHTGFDNLAFASKDDLLVVEDAGDTLHGQRNALDSGYLITLHGSSEKPEKVVRWLAEGRDASATYDAITPPTTKNDGDNEITGIHVSDGDAGTAGILGAKNPNLFDGSWRGFWTQQHGDNTTWELGRASTSNRD
jgi:hypothetical protein